MVTFALNLHCSQAVNVAGVPMMVVLASSHSTSIGTRVKIVRRLMNPLMISMYSWLFDSSVPCSESILADMTKVVPLQDQLRLGVIVDVMEAVLGVWEWALLASVSLQLALCVSCWRVYRELRMAGLYAPDRPADVATRKTTEISVMEIMCEAEDIEYLQAFELKCEGGAAEQYNVSLPLLSEA
ncbi:unnamed protein product, partial [Polarella glacialis]